MKKIITLFVLLVVVVGSYAQTQLLFDENAEIRNLSQPFNKIVVSGSVDVFLTNAPIQVVAVSAKESSSITKLRTTVSGSTLTVNGAGSGADAFKIYIGVPTLQSITLSGKSNVVLIDTFKTENFEIATSGSATIMGGLQVINFELNTSGSTQVKLTGIGTNTEYNTSGISELNLGNFACMNVVVNCSGSSQILVDAAETLEINASGFSDVTYTGTAIPVVHASGKSNVKKYKTP